MLDIENIDSVAKVNAVPPDYRLANGVHGFSRVEAREKVQKQQKARRYGRAFRSKRHR